MDELIRLIERALAQEGGMKLGQLRRIQRLHEIERNARQLGGLRRALQAAHAAGNVMSRAELRALQAARSRALASAGLRSLHARYLFSLARAGIVTRHAAVILASGVGAALVITLAIGLGIYLATREDPEKQVANAINCDCSGINAGILNVGWVPECRGHEKKLQELAANGQLNIEVNDEGIITGGDLCGWPGNGPAAWPVKGATKTPPSAQLPKKECSSFTGLIRACGD